MDEKLQIRVHGSAELPTLIYLPGLHGDWTLVTSFRHAIAGRVRFVEFTYPRTLTWTLDDYARAVFSALKEHGISTGWLLGESFGSQLVWPMLQLQKEHGFEAKGVILAGGFITHPRKCSVTFAHLLLRTTPKWLLKLGIRAYTWYAPLRHRNAPETLAAMDEFVARRTKQDAQAMLHRLDLIEAADYRAFTRTLKLPIFYLTGILDPVVPWLGVGADLRRNCPSLVETKMLAADHNVLGSAPAKSADVITAWMR